jgi:TolB protein
MRHDKGWSMRCVALTLGLLALGTAPLAGQQDTTRLPPGVALEGRYTLANRPALSVRPFEAAAIVGPVAASVSQILDNDLRLSDRFSVRPTPESLAWGPVDYAPWNSLGIVWLVTGEVTATPTGFQLAITLHDVVYGTIKQTRTFPLPLATAPDFRMAVHSVSDEIVQWIFNQPGMAASRIAFRRHNPNGTFDLLVVDSDGEDLRRIFGSEMAVYSPTWSPDGRTLAYTQRETEGWRLVERDMQTGRTRVIQGNSQLIMTPAYSPDGTKLAFGMHVPGGIQIHDYDVSRGCCMRRLSSAPMDNLSPTYAPDGQRLALHSTRTRAQHIYVMPADGGTAAVVTPFGERVEYAAPDWSPNGSLIAFHGASRGTKQIMVVDADRPGSQVRQLTTEGINEDASWAPDGRHIVFSSSGMRGGGPGLYVIDMATGNIRRLASGRLQLADWSPSLAALVQVAASN